MATLKNLYAASATITISPASTATSSTRVAGVESDVISNATNLYLDALVSGKITTGTSPTASKQIDIWVYASQDDTPSYADVLDGTGSAETITSENVRNAAMKLACSILVDNTSDRTYYMAPVSVASLFGGVLPQRWGLFISHDTGVNLNSTGGNHAFSYQGVQIQSV